ncbi:MAG: endonuclease MutS2 [Meiothermus sp.]
MRDPLEALEFARIRQALADRASTFMGQEAALTLTPKPTLEEALAQQATIAEALGYPYRLGGISDIRAPLAAAREGKRLQGLELLGIAHTLEAAIQLKHELLEIGERLSAIAAQIGEHTLYRRRVAESLEEGGAVKDSASPRLAQIRKRLNPLREQIHERLYSLMDRAGNAIQERYITLRRDRYVIPVKASFQHQVPGIVLDQSDTGLTVFIEPSSVVPLNNQLYSLRLEEEAEVARILFELTGLLAQDPEIDQTLSAITALDLARAGAALAEDWKLSKPRFNLEGTYRLEGAWHPLIPNPVANDLELSQAARLMLLTGPNMGGKTALLKTLGLAVLMAQSGLYVAARSAQLSFPDQVFVDIGDEQSLEASLSTFAAHLLRLKEVLAEATPQSLVLVDELGSGTDPEEGAALSQAFLEALLERGARGLITTHLSPLKAFAQETPGVQNASMRFDLEHLAPTYQLVVGTPGRSYALAIARRLGFPEALNTRAEALLGPEGGRVERLLAALEAERESLRQRLAEAEQLQSQARREREELQARLSELEHKREQLLEEARREAEGLVSEAQERLRQVRLQGKSAGQGRALQELMQLRSRYQKPAKPSPASSGVVAGATVQVPEYNAQARVLEVRGGEALVQMGSVRMSLPLASLRPLEAPKPQPAGARVKSRFDCELNLRGMTVDEALLAIDDFLTEAKSLGESPVRLLHGKGTGALRNAIREALRRDKRVENFHDAVPYEGGHGVTVVHLRR